MGKIIADYFVTDSGGKGNAVIEHVPAYPILDGFTDGFKNEVKATVPGVQDLDHQRHDPRPRGRKGAEHPRVGAAANPDANYLVFDDGPFADGITSALSAAGLNGKVKVIGEAADQAGIAALKTGQRGRMDRV